MNWRTTAALFVILVALGAVVFWQSRQEAADADAIPTVAAPAAETTPLFPGVTAGDLLRLEVERAEGAEDGAAVHFERQDDGAWVQTVPTTTMVISQTLESRAGSLLAVSSRRALPPDANPLSAYGLDQPGAAIVVAARRANQDGSEQVIRHTLHVGNQTPAEDGYYVQKVGDRRVHIIPLTAVDTVLSLIDDPPHQQPASTP